jgi:hypothetical protein
MKIFRDVFASFMNMVKSILCKREVLKLSFHNEVGSYYEVLTRLKTLSTYFLRE